MRPRLLLSLLLATPVVAAPPPPPTLTSLDCPSRCHGRPCLVYAAAERSSVTSAQCVETMVTTGAWTLDLADAPLATRIQNVTYPAKNGVERVVIRGSGATHARDGSVLATPDSVTSLFVSGVQLPASRYWDLQLPPRAWQRVTLENVGLTSIPKAFETLPLDALSVPFNSLTDVDLHLPRLHTLNLSGNPLTTIPSAIFRMTSLRSLSFRQCNLTNVAITPSQLSFLRLLPTLEIDLSVSSCPDGSISISLFEAGGGGVICLQAPRFPTTAVARRLSTGKSNTVTIVVVVVACVVAVALGALFCWCRHRRRRADEPEMSFYPQQHPGRAAGYVPAIDGYSQPQSANGRPRGSPSRPNADVYDGFLPDENAVANSSVWQDPVLQKHRLDKDALELVSTLAKTTLCEIWLATYARETVVVKTLTLASSIEKLRLATALASAATDYFSAIDHAGVVSHRNIVQVLGVSWSRAFAVQVVMAHAEGGDLRALLGSDDAKSLTWSETKCQLLLDVVDALGFLQTQAERMQRLHTCSLVSSRNVLIDAAGTAQLNVVQFGMEDERLLPTASSLLYIAPEIILGEKSTARGLVYSLGVLLAELDTTSRPFDDVVNPDGSKTSPFVIITRIAKGELKPTLSDDCPESLATLARECWAFEAAERPTLERVTYTLRDILKNEL